MLSYYDYVNQPIPEVHFGIRDDTLNEEIKAKHYLGYVGPKQHYPTDNGYKLYYGNSIYQNNKYPNKFFHFSGTSVPKAFNSMSDVLEHDSNEREKQEKAIDVIGHSLIDHYANNVRVTPDEHDAISAYTSPYSSLNRKLLAHKLTDLDRQQIHHVDSVLSRGKTPDDLVVYTGTNKDHAETLAKESIVKHPAYLSSSLSLRKAKAFAESKDGSVVAIHLPVGHSGLYLQHISRIPSEREFLLPRGLKLSIDHSKDEMISVDKNKHRVLHHANVVNSNTPD